MARIEPRTWLGTHDAAVERCHRRSIRYDVYIPDPLMGRPVLLPSEIVEGITTAEQKIRLLNETRPTLASLEAAARLLLRAEAVGSSRIEELEVGARRLLRAEAGRAIDPSSGKRDVTAEAVLGNIEAMQLAVGELSEREQLSLDDLLEMHRALMRHTPHPEIGGVVRTTQNWIGKTDYGPYDAEFVPPPPELVPDLLQDLVAYLNSAEHPALVQAALAHAQFETIHPFGDGNGRVGRAIIHLVLRRRGIAARLVPPISLVLAAHSRDYIRGLTASRYCGEPNELASIEGVAEWLRVFVTAAIRAADDALGFGRRIDDLERGWRRAAALARRGSATDLLLSALAAAPIITISTAARLVQRSIPAAGAAVDRLVSSGVLVPIRNVRRNRAFEANGYVEMFTQFERSIASPVGHTREAPPVRVVPRRPQRP